VSSKACKRAEARNRQQFQNKQTSKEKSRGPQNPSRETLGGGGGILPVAISGRYLPGGGGGFYTIYGLHSDLAKSSLEMIAIVSTPYIHHNPPIKGELCYAYSLRVGGALSLYCIMEHI
jgi:hypothetical protein